MKFATYALTFGLIAVLSGCASSAKREAPVAGAATTSMQAKAAFPLKEFSVSLSDAARAKLADNLKFDRNKLAETMKRALEAKGLLKSEDVSAVSKLEIEITDIRVRSNFSATAFGILAGTDSVDGTVRILNASGTVVDTIKVSASYGLGGWGGGQDEARMSWLYEKFAEESVKALTGT